MQPTEIDEKDRSILLSQIVAVRYDPAYSRFTYVRLFNSHLNAHVANRFSIFPLNEHFIDSLHRFHFFTAFQCKRVWMEQSSTLYVCVKCVYSIIYSNELVMTCDLCGLSSDSKFFFASNLVLIINCAWRTNNRSREWERERRQMARSEKCIGIGCYFCAMNRFISHR